MLFEINLLNFSFLFTTVAGWPIHHTFRSYTDGNETVVFTFHRTRTIQCSIVIDEIKESEAGDINTNLVTTTMMNILRTTCRHMNHHYRTKRNTLFPGTKWCGLGDSAVNNSDLGEYRESDACCRDHDLCDVYIEPFSYRYDLYNLYPYSKTSCECEEQFYSCLKNSTDDVADSIGRIYFNIITPSCIRPVKNSKCLYNSFWNWLTSSCDETHVEMEWGTFNRTF